jgi:hypothetical protein
MMTTNKHILANTCVGNQEDNMKPISISAVVGARTKSALTWVGSLGLALYLVSTPTYATDTSIGANTGYARLPECFQRVGGSKIVNIGSVDVCNGQFWIIPLLTPFTGHTYRVRVRAAPGGTGMGDIASTACQVYSIDTENNSAGGVPSGPQYTAGHVPGTLEDLPIVSIYVPAFGDRNRHGPATLQVECVVGGPNGAVQSVDLNCSTC